jgi:hypothetical protein
LFVAAVCNGFCVHCYCRLVCKLLGLVHLPDGSLLSFLVQFSWPTKYSQVLDHICVSLIKTRFSRAQEI